MTLNKRANTPTDVSLTVCMYGVLFVFLYLPVGFRSCFFFTIFRRASLFVSLLFHTIILLSLFLSRFFSPDPNFW